MFGLGGQEVGIIGVLFFLLIFSILPFIINAKLARSRGKSVPLMLLLTLVFSWIVTLILAVMPRADAEEYRTS